jgi:hypothetical protein
MHGVLVDVEIDTSKLDEADAMLNGVVIPRVTGQPGFVKGYWFRSPDGSRGCSTLLFDSETSAQAALASVPEPPEGGPIKKQYTELFELVAER